MFIIIIRVFESSDVCCCALQSWSGEIVLSWFGENVGGTVVRSKAGRMDRGVADQAGHWLGVGGECLLAVITRCLIRDLQR